MIRDAMGFKGEVKFLTDVLGVSTKDGRNEAATWPDFQFTPMAAA